MEGEHKQVTILFADLQGSMALAEELGAEEWHRILDRFFEILSDGVHRFEGTVNQYTGDGIMALFGAPIAHEDHAQRACFAALHLREALRDFADGLRRDRGVSLSTRIGMNSGEVVVGKIGDDLRMDYTAQGHTVGLAQRMEQRAAPDSAYLTEHTAKLVEGYFALRSLGAFDLKGVSHPTEVFALEGLGEIRTRLDRSRARGFSRFVGRAEEIETLENALDGAIGGRGGIVGVVAQAGVGKSRLCMEFAQQTRASGVTVYEAHCPSHGAAIPLLPILELMRGFFGLQDDDDARTAREKITGRLLVLDRSLEPLLPLALDFLAVADHDSAPLTMSAAERQRELITLIRRLIQARSQREPAVLLIDDVHWIDPASDEFLAAVAETIVGTRTLLLLNFRPEYDAEWMKRSTYQQLPLHPLGDRATDALLADLLGDDASLAPLNVVIRERSGGNPFFMEEIVQNLRESGRLEGERGAMHWVDSTERIEVPATVHAILGARVDRLPEREKQLLQTAAAIGRTFREPLLRRVANLDRRDFDEAIRNLSRAEFVHEQVLYPEIEYAFRHPLTHEVAARSQLADRRRRVHADVASALEEMHAGHLDEHSPLLAHHWDEAGEAEPAAIWHRRAAERIAGSHAAEARRHWQRVRTLSDEIDDEALSSELGERSRLMILEYGWRLGASESETNAALEEGEAWANRRGGANALAALYNAVSVNLLLVHAETERAASMIEKGLRLVAESDNRALAFSLELRGYLAAEYRGHVPEMLRRMDRMHAFPPEVMESAQPILGYDPRALAVGFRSNPLCWSGRLDEGLAQSLEGEAIARESGSLEVMSWLLAYQTEHRTAIGDLDAAFDTGHRAVELSQRIESPLSIAVSSAYLGYPLVRSGRFEEALGLLRPGLELARSTARTVESETLSLLALAELGLDRSDSARAFAEAALSVAAAGLFDRHRVVALMALARVRLRAREDSACSASLDAAETLTDQTGCIRYHPEILEIRAQLADAEGERARAQTHRARACELYREMGAPLHAERIESGSAA